MKKILLLTLTILLIYSCSSEEESPVAIPVQTPETFGAWGPSFSDQTTDFTQTREGNQGTTESRQVTISSSAASEGTNERIDGVDKNDDGDIVDYYANITTTYSASIGGNFSVESYEITNNQAVDFLTRNFGVWANVNDGSYIEATITYDDESSAKVATGLAYDITDVSATLLTQENITDTCWILDDSELPSDVDIEIVQNTGDNYDIDIYGLEPEGLITQADIDLLLDFGVTRIGQYTTIEVVDYDSVSALFAGAAIYALFDDGSEYVFYSVGWTMLFYGYLDADEYACPSTTGKGFDNSSYVEKFNLENKKSSLKEFLSSKENIKTSKKLKVDREKIKELIYKNRK